MLAAEIEQPPAAEAGLTLAGMSDTASAATAYTLSRLTAVLCHEINQPLNAISMAAHNGKRMVLRECIPVTELHQRLDRIGLEARRAGKLAHLMAELAAAGTDHRRSMGTRLRQIEELYRTSLQRRGLEIEMSIDDAINGFDADPAVITAALVWSLEQVEDRSPRGSADRVARIDIGVEGSSRTPCLTVTGAVGAPDEKDRSIIKQILLSSGGRLQCGDRWCRIDVPRGTAP
jgi:signal transduction histidine kinase